VEGGEHRPILTPLSVARRPTPFRLASGPGPAILPDMSPLTLALLLAAAPAPGISFVHDDYPRALALARTRGVPIAVDVWTPW